MSDGGSISRKIKCTVRGEEAEAMVVTSGESVTIGDVGFNRTELLTALGVASMGMPYRQSAKLEGQMDLDDFPEVFEP
jgi:hypothetical protein